MSSFLTTWCPVRRVATRAVTPRLSLAFSIPSLVDGESVVGGSVAGGPFAAVLGTQGNQSRWFVVAAVCMGVSTAHLAHAQSKRSDDVQTVSAKAGEQPDQLKAKTQAAAPATTPPAAQTLAEPPPRIAEEEAAQLETPMAAFEPEGPDSEVGDPEASGPGPVALPNNAGIAAGAPLPVAGLEPYYFDRRRYGMKLTVVGSGWEDSALGGIGVAFRWRPRSRVALDIGLQFVGGRDDYDLDRSELPVFANALFYLNPDSFAQFFVSAGLSVNFVRREGYESTRGRFVDTDSTSLGVSGGAGVEIAFAEMTAFTAELQGLARARLDESPSFGVTTEEERDLRTGVLLAIGGILYF